MQTILWFIIMAWSLLVFITVFVDWIKWMPTDEKISGKIKSIFLYRLKMMVKMIVPAILSILGAMAVLL